MGPEYMKNREPFDLKNIMMVYNVLQVMANGYIAYLTLSSAHLIDWNCTPIDYTDSYWGRKFVQVSYIYYCLKLADLLDTVFFVLRKKAGHLSFLHTYHHFGMAIVGWLGARFLPGGHSWFLGVANSMVHTLLYSYYLLTAYDSRYAKFIWLKKMITQAQLAQFVFLQYAYTKLLFVPKCQYPKEVLFLFIPQNTFMIVLFSDFYIRKYILEPRREKRLAEQARQEKKALTEENNKGF